MAGHKERKAALEQALSGVRVNPSAIPWEGGSVNFKLMVWFARFVNALLGLLLDLPGAAAELAAAEKPLLDKLRAMKVDGLFAIRGSGSNPTAHEGLAPMPHSTFNLDAVCGGWERALRHGRTEIAKACEWVIGCHLAACAALSVKGVVCAPGPRAKDEDDRTNKAKVGQWRQRDSDALLALLNRKPPQYKGRCARAFAAILGRPDGEAIRTRLKAFPLRDVRLAIPVTRYDLGGGTYQAMIDDTPENRKILAADPLSWVVFGPGMEEPELGYDWSVPPEIPAGAPVTVIGGAG